MLRDVVEGLQTVENSGSGVAAWELGNHAKVPLVFDTRLNTIRLYLLGRRKQLLLASSL